MIENNTIYKHTLMKWQTIMKFNLYMKKKNIQFKNKL